MFIWTTLTVLIFQKIYLSLFNKSLISNESDYHEILEPCVLSDDFGNSGYDQPKEPLVETFENVSNINVTNSLVTYCRLLWNPHQPFLRIISLLLGIKLLFLMKSRDCWRLVVFVKLNVMKHRDLVRWGLQRTVKIKIDLISDLFSVCA